MNYGMLWFDDDPSTELPHKIERAAEYYEEKYGKAPNLCYVNPDMISEDTPRSSMLLKTSPTIMRDHFWIGHSPKKGN